MFVDFGDAGSVRRAGGGRASCRDAAGGSGELEGALAGALDTLKNTLQLTLKNTLQRRVSRVFVYCAETEKEIDVHPCGVENQRGPPADADAWASALRREWRPDRSERQPFLF